MAKVEVFTVKIPCGLREALQKAADERKKSRNKFVVDTLIRASKFKI